MVTRFFTVVNNNPADNRLAHSDSIHAKIWRTSWVCALTVSCSLWTGCQSTRLGSRSDSLAALQSEEAEAERDSKNNKSGFTSFFSRWWPTDSKDDAYDLGLPRVEEDYVSSDPDLDAKGSLSDKNTNSKTNSPKSPTSPAEKRKSQFAKKSPTNISDDSDGLDASQRDLYRRQMEAMRRLGLNDDDLGDILADDSADSSFDGIVQLPPVNQPKPSPNAPTNPNAPEKPGFAIDGTGTRLKIRDDSTPPPPPAAFQNPLVNAQPSPSNPNYSVAQNGPSNPSGPPANAFDSSNKMPGLKPFEFQPPQAYGFQQPTNPAQPMNPVPPMNAVQGAGASNNDPSAIVPGAYFENVPPSVATTNWESDVRQAVIKLQDRLTNDKTLTAKERTNLEARLRLMQLASNDTDAALNPNQGWNKDADQWFRYTLMGIREATALTGPESPNQRFTLVAKHQQEAAQHLLSLSDLEVNNVTFCTEVLSYGQVTKRPANALTANEEIILYCEFNNFAALKVHDGYETEFEARYEIVDLQNNRIYEEKLPTDRQTSANRRRDYFIAYQMYLPKDISPGHYRLKLNVKDVKAGKFGQGLVEFQIVK